LRSYRQVQGRRPRCSLQQSVMPPSLGRLIRVQANKRKRASLPTPEPESDDQERAASHSAEENSEDDDLEVESTETLRFLDGVEAGDGKGRTAVR
jgi:hypothetical protein